MKVPTQFVASGSGAALSLVQGTVINFRWRDYFKGLEAETRYNDKHLLFSDYKLSLIMPLIGSHLGY